VYVEGPTYVCPWKTKPNKLINPGTAIALDGLLLR
jgi:hypothetical protein